MKAKLKLFLTDDIYAILTVSIDLPKDQKTKAEMVGIGEHEQNNLVGQALNTMLAQLGNSDEA